MPSGIKRIFATKLTDVFSDDRDNVGTIRFEGNKVYKYVKVLNTTATVAIVAGDAVAYNAVTGHSVHQVVSDVSDADAAPMGAGLVTGAHAGVLLVATFGWIQIVGSAVAAQNLAGTPADGDELMMGGDKAMTVRLWGGTTPNIQAVGSSMGYTQDDSADLVMLACPW